ncbi:MAG: hypothetical protein ABSE70_10390 [Candidatus Limnocylindrales bacterium]
MPAYLRTDAQEEAVSALEMFSDSLGAIATNRYRWKWAVLALHAAVQGFMVLGLRGSNDFDVLSPAAAKDWLAAVEAGDPPPFDQKRLDTFLGLYRKVKSDRMLRYVNSKQFHPGKTHDRSLAILNELRNEFTHFLPKHWSLEVSGLPAICGDCLDLIEFLGWDSGNVMWIGDDVEVRTRRALAEARRQILSAHTQGEA